MQYSFTTSENGMDLLWGLGDEIKKKPLHFMKKKGWFFQDEVSPKPMD